jgi:hypothetical protein
MTIKPVTIFITIYTLLFIFVQSGIAQSNLELCEQAYNSENFSVAFPICLKAAEAGNVNAQYYVAVMYSSGNGVAEDLERYLFVQPRGVLYVVRIFLKSFRNG